ncbi:LacI family DNA-binding transcriptional regulator [Tellurirhabdus bombi]|uniref:LacI family DNA-binding transcriptional regulator n=1 Tax=Tellurirhabdus bombi TaxID=2907205 RepID=UPI001F294F24|nr:LacI family DNA-binding transcriptional regulator [Tellurirhabdus bombi]
MKEVVTIKEIARQLNVSPSTVSRALQNHPRISIQTREAIRALAEKLKYLPSTTARNLQRGKTGVIGVVLPKAGENFFADVINGVEELAFAHQFTVALYQSHDHFEREKQILNVLASNRVDGVLLSVAAETAQFDHIQELIDRQIPVVLFDRIPPNLAAHQVSCNIERGAYEATKWLAQRGYQRIAFLNGPHALVASEERYRGYITALLEEGLPVENALIKRVDLTTEDAFLKMNQLLNGETRPDAVLAFNEYVALDAMQACRLNGLSVNRDIAFVSFANIGWNKYLEHPPLASVEQHPQKIGYKAAEILLRVISGEIAPTDLQKIILEPELIIRG